MPTRRHFVKNAAAVTLGFTGLQSFMGCASQRPRLIPSTMVEDPLHIIDLPEGFSFKIISRSGQPMSDGFLVPQRPDGMAAFPGDGGLTILVRNHEIDVNADTGPFGPNNRLLTNLEPGMLYDPGHGRTPSQGGTTTLVYDTKKQEVVREFLSLAGTQRNCAGGLTPWNSWVTCEETVVRAGDVCEHDHGYNFEVPATMQPGLAVPTPLKAMGRFNHEAIAVDPDSGVVYQTEDRHDGAIYRFIPNTPGQLADGGRLQALAVVGRPALDTRNWARRARRRKVKVGDIMEVRWIDLDNVEAPEDDLRYRGFDAGAARFARGEGMWYGDGVVYFACTNGGSKKKGQIWKYTPSPAEAQPGEQDQPGRLELFIEPDDGNVVENADNITIAPWGDLFVCEDGPGSQNLLRVTPAGEVIRFGTNLLSESEFAGSTFSPDGTTLFVNIQTDGLTLAITGPWNELGAD